MTKLELIMILLPIVFMIHEYEEIIMFKYWLGNNRNELKRRFPKFEQFLPLFVAGTHIDSLVNSHYQTKSERQRNEKPVKHSCESKLCSRPVNQ